MIGSLALVVLAWAHPLHTTHTEVRELAGGAVEVTIRAFSEDLEAAVRRQEGAMGDSALARYVRSRVELHNAAGEPVQLGWAGAARDGEATLLRLRATVPKGLARGRIRQAMLSELFQDQVNVVHLRGPRRASLLFLPGDGPKSLP